MLDDDYLIGAVKARPKIRDKPNPGLMVVWCKPLRHKTSRIVYEKAMVRKSADRRGYTQWSWSNSISWPNNKQQQFSNDHIRQRESPDNLPKSMIDDDETEGFIIDVLEIESNAASSTVRLPLDIPKTHVLIISSPLQTGIKSQAKPCVEITSKSVGDTRKKLHFRRKFRELVSKCVKKAYESEQD
uniref:Uncharacterized protein n=1 Tax=Timema cristinae TaxID=61476 RepID=A0A7R9H674_TIMCR|nr:unnamed protein product [Timema cristinae]